MSCAVPPTLPGMSLSMIVCNAARANNLKLLKICFKATVSHDMETLVSTKVGGATPLVIACRHGHYDIVEYLLTKCHANVEQVGSVTFGGETIEDAPPLWCAAAAGHLGIVRLLVRRGANVNSTTRTNSTPLRAACFDGHFEIVKFLINYGADFEVANRHGHTCLMIACYNRHYRIAQYLLALKADVNRRSVKGNTALHDCAESGSLEILQLLLKHGAVMGVDYYGMTPLLAASVTGHLPIVEHLISLPCVKREERINALELLGATYMDKKRDMRGALSLWWRAMGERNKEPKLPKNVKEPIAAYEYAKEATTIEELEDLAMDPDEMRMQALVIRQRILGPTHPDTSYYIRFRGAHYADAGRFDRCIELWTYALTMQQKILQPLSPMTQSSFLSFTELFSFMLVEAGRPLPRGRVVPPIRAQDMLMIFERAVREVGRGQILHIGSKYTNPPNLESDPDALSCALVNALHIACLLACLLEDEDFTSEIKHDFFMCMYRLNKFKVVVSSGRTPLHYACFRETTVIGRYPTCQFPSAALVKALLLVGADPNVKDDAGNTPLHLAATAESCPKELAQALLEHGAHLDTRNIDGETFESLLETQKIHEIVNPLKYTTLKCLAARAVQKHRIKYHGNIPVSLYEFVKIH